MLNMNFFMKGNIMAQPVIRPMLAADYPAIKRIYQAGVDSGASTFEQAVPAFLDWDAAHCQFCRFVSVSDGEVSGFAVLSPTSRRKVFSGVCEVSIYIDPAFFRQGIGRLLLQTLIDASEQAGVWTLTAGIFPENTASIALHESMGFRLIGRRERVGFHLGRWRDTLLFERRSKKVGLDGYALENLPC